MIQNFISRSNRFARSALFIWGMLAAIPSLAASEPGTDLNSLLATINSSKETSAQKAAFERLKALLKIHLDKYKDSAQQLADQAAQLEIEAKASQGQPKQIYENLSADLRTHASRVQATLDSARSALSAAAYPDELAHTAEQVNPLKVKFTLEEGKLAARKITDQVVKSFGCNGLVSFDLNRQTQEKEVQLLGPKDKCMGVFSAGYAEASPMKILSSLDLGQITKTMDGRNCYSLGTVPIADVDFVKWVIGKSDQQMLKITCERPNKLQRLQGWAVSNKFCPTYTKDTRTLKAYFWIKDQGHGSTEVQRYGQDADCPSGSAMNGYLPDVQLGSIIKAEYEKTRSGARNKNVTAGSSADGGESLLGQPRATGGALNAQ